MIEDYLPENIFVNLYGPLLIIYIVLVFDMVKGLLQVRTLHRNAILNSLPKGSDTLEILLITVNDTFESLFRFL
jgi:hypothetical protein